LRLAFYGGTKAVTAETKRVTVKKIALFLRSRDKAQRGAKRRAEGRRRRAGGQGEVILVGKGGMVAAKMRKRLKKEGRLAAGEATAFGLVTELRVVLGSEVLGRDGRE
jgi:hypothetical protein